MSSSPAEAHPGLTEDIIPGAGLIAANLYGSDTRANRKKVFYAVAQGSLPVFRIGRTLCARKSTLIAWISEQERASRAPRPAPVQLPRRSRRR